MYTLCHPLHSPRSIVAAGLAPEPDKQAPGCATTIFFQPNYDSSSSFKKCETGFKVVLFQVLRSWLLYSNLQYRDGRRDLPRVKKGVQNPHPLYTERAATEAAPVAVEIQEVHPL